MPVARLRALPALLALVAIAVSGCARSAPSSEANALPIRVVTTISTLESFVRGVGGNRVHVDSIVPIGASPETFEPTPQDAAKVARAQLVVENGAGLEAWIDRLLHDGAPSTRVVVASDGLAAKNANPHLWMNPQYAKKYVLNIRDGLIAVDPGGATVYRRNAAQYNAELDALTARIQQQVNSLPPSHRYMIVFHNAWQYYNDRFGITTLGFVERNPGQDPNPQQIAGLVDLAKQHGVHAVFSEPEYSPKLLSTISQGAGISVIENLYDDSLGTDPRVADYISMLQYDTGIIVRGLR